MNHQTAKIIAESYRSEVAAIRNGESDNPAAGLSSMGWRDRMALLYDHAAVWERVAAALKEAPHVP